MVTVSMPTFSVSLTRKASVSEYFIPFLTPLADNNRCKDLNASLFSILGSQELHQVLDIHASGITLLLRSPAWSGSLYPLAWTSDSSLFPFVALSVCLPFNPAFAACFISKVT